MRRARARADGPAARRAREQALEAIGSERLRVAAKLVVRGNLVVAPHEANVCGRAGRDIRTFPRGDP
jgi:hypothetical protein